MVSQIGGHRGCPLESHMDTADVVHHTHPKHRGFTVWHLPGGGARTAGQGGQPGAEGGMQPLAIRRIDHPERDLGGLHDRLGAAQAAVGHPAVDSRALPSGVLRDVPLIAVYLADIDLTLADHLCLNGVRMGTRLPTTPARAPPSTGGVSAYSAGCRVSPRRSSRRHGMCTVVRRANGYRFGRLRHRPRWGILPTPGAWEGG